MAGVTAQQSARRSKRKARERVTKVRMSEAEWESMADYQRYGFFSRSELIRWLVDEWASGAQEFATLPLPDAASASAPAVVSQPSADARAIVDAVNKVGVNINQIAADLNRRRKFDEAHPSAKKQKEPLDRQDWMYLRAAVEDAVRVIEQANAMLLAIQGTVGTPDNFRVPKPLTRRESSDEL